MSHDILLPSNLFAWQPSCISGSQNWSNLFTWLTSSTLCSGHWSHSSPSRVTDLKLQLLPTLNLFLWFMTSFLWDNYLGTCEFSTYSNILIRPLSYIYHPHGSVLFQSITYELMRLWGGNLDYKTIRHYPWPPRLMYISLCKMHLVHL